MWTNRFGTKFKLRSVADVESFMSACNLQDIQFGQWGQFRTINDPGWHPNVNHEAQQGAVPTSTVVPVTTANLIGRRVHKKFPGYGWFMGTIVGVDYLNAKYHVRFDDDETMYIYSYKKVRSILLP
jgi:hypothetical protein